MKFNFKLKRLCGSYYGNPGNKDRGSNLVFDSTGHRLICAVSNRIQVIDLKSHGVRTLPIEARSDIVRLALSPDDCILITVDSQHYGLIIHLTRSIILHRMKFNQYVRAIQFSPNGQYVAVAVGKQTQVWCSPAYHHHHHHRTVSGWILHRTYTGLANPVTCLAFSADHSVMVAGGQEGACRIYTTHTTRNYRPFTISGHKRAVLGVAFCEPVSTTLVHDDDDDGEEILSTQIVSIDEDGAVVVWKCVKPGNAFTPNVKNIEGMDNDIQKLGEEEDDVEEEEEEDTDTDRPSSKRQRVQTLLSHQIVNRIWRVAARHYLSSSETTGAHVASCAYCNHSRLLAVGYSNGLFGLYELLPDFGNVHTLSVGNGQLISACALTKTGDWLALACPRSQQLLVWEWRSETYVLKQRGHAYRMRCMAYSEDGIIVCTGGEDGKIKLWNAGSGFCYVTLEQSHTAPITGVTFANASVVLSSSLDGTVRAHDLHRYRTFRTLTSPTPTQFVSLAADSSGELVVAGSMDPFHIYCWNLQTGKLIDVLTGHAGPICSLSFQATGGILASGSWDGTVKLWDLYKQTIPTESFQHSSDVTCVTFRPDGQQICVATLGGLLSFWHIESAKLQFEIDGRRDIAGGRKVNDRMASDNNATSRYFTSVCYTADGSCVLAGGNSKYVCIYEVSQQILVKKFQVSHNRSLDGVLDELNSKRMGDFGPLECDSGEEDDAERVLNPYFLPGARREDDGSRKSKIEVLTSQVAFSSTGREWAAVSGEGLHVYGLDDDMIFDPILLKEDITPASICNNLNKKEYGRALLMALHLNEFAVVKEVMEEIPYDSIGVVVKNLHVQDRELERLIQILAQVLEESVHIQFFVEWCLRILMLRGLHIDRKENRNIYLRALRSLYKAMQARNDDIQMICKSNTYTLDVLRDHIALTPCTGTPSTGTSIISYSITPYP